MRKTVTLKHVAEDAGVSVNTASIVLRGRAKDLRISSERAKQINEAARRLGYLPNAAARAARTGRFGNIALILSVDVERSFIAPQLFSGIHDGLAEAGQHLLVARLPDERLTDAKYVPRIVNELNADGLIINYTHGEPKQLDTLVRRHRVPVIWLNNRRDSDCVYSDDMAIAMNATQELIALGHQRIAYVDITVAADEIPRKHYSRRDRESGYREAMTQAGLKPRTIRPDRPLKGVAPSQFLTDALNGPDRPTALLFYSAGHAQFGILACQRLGLRVPEDLSITGFHITPQSFDGRVIDIVLMPDRKLGRQAVNQLMRKIENPSMPLPPLAVADSRCIWGQTVSRL